MSLGSSLRRDTPSVVDSKRCSEFQGRAWQRAKTPDPIPAANLGPMNWRPPARSTLGGAPPRPPLRPVWECPFCREGARLWCARAVLKTNERHLGACLGGCFEVSFQMTAHLVVCASLAAVRLMPVLSPLRPARCTHRPLLAMQNDTSSAGQGAVAALKFYKSIISPLMPPSCRFIPTCSE